MKDVKINVRLSVELRDKFSEKCDRKSINKSEWIRKKIKEYVEDDKQ